jgi:hypothetical protein
MARGHSTPLHAIADLARSLALPSALPPSVLRRARALVAAVAAELRAEIAERGIVATAERHGAHRDTLHAWSRPGEWLHAPTQGDDAG